MHARPSRIYLDHAATSPLVPEAKEAMLRSMDDGFANPSSHHHEGRKARALVDEAREVVADRLGCSFAEVVFTSGGTEAANLAILGTALANLHGERKRILVSSFEHHCVLHLAGVLRRLGFALETVPVGSDGLADPDAWKATLADDVLLCGLMHANNEIGTIQPVEEVANAVAHHGAVFFSDAVQTFGGGYQFRGIGADLLAVSAHKIGGPRGVGALYVRAGTRVNALIQGGGQEREKRGGTENLLGIVGFGAAVRAQPPDGSGDRAKSQARQAFLERLESSGNGFCQRTVDYRNCLPGHAHLLFPGLDSERLLIALDVLGVSASAGSACSAGSVEPSHVLKAIGLSDELAGQGVRFTFGPKTSIDEAVEAADRVVEAVNRVRSGRSGMVNLA